ncbi:MAG: 1-acyl-sn-glycerol-3-phosphate acyltransferase [Alphaproteobacteria bacterium]|nr:1-acyl-sn-glycerol-3-phosphate acyltransferase [Alphaproteobacteria bacterium]
MRAAMGKAVAVFKLIAFAFLYVIVIPVQGTVLLFTKGPKSYILPRLWYAAVCRVFSIRVKIHGTPATTGQTLYMSNHLSYMDIAVIGSVIKASFVAKSDVAGWPLLGYLATLQQTAFVQRKRTEAGRQKNELQSRIESGESLTIFPEGTSTDGRDVLPFKSSLFALALLDATPDLHVQPVTVVLSSVAGRVPQTQEDRDLYAWHRDMDTPLADHLWRFAQTNGATITLIFHTPLKARDFGDRKALAQACQDAVSSGLSVSDRISSAV